MQFTALYGKRVAVCSSFKAGHETRDSIAERAEEYKKKSIFASLIIEKAFNCVNHVKLWIVLRKMGITNISLFSYETYT